ncbi:MAG: PaaI family thioesterase [Candidatus Mariimomonas ferrooxydans]
MKLVQNETLADNGYCFVCGPKNPIGLRLKFHFNGKTIKTEFIPKKEHQGYLNIVHGGIISTLLDEAMVKLAIAMDMPAVTARIEIRLRKALNVGEKVIIEAEILKNTKKLLEAYAKAVTENNMVIADAKGKLVKA